MVVPGGRVMLMARKRSPPEGNKLIGITSINPRLAIVITDAETRVKSLCLRAQIRTPATKIEGSDSELSRC